MIPRELVDGFTRTINATARNAKANLQRRLERMDLSDPDEAAKEVSRVMTAYAKTYSAQIATLATRFYDEARRLELGEALGATPDAMYNAQATEEAARGILYKYSDASARASELLLRMDYEVMKAAANAVYSAGERDTNTPRFARVPSGSETCLFCIMLASRGFVYYNERTAGSDGHYHANCDCRIVPSWKGNIEGYDPRALYDRYRERSREIAEERAEKYGTSVKYELGREQAKLNEASKKAKERRKQERIARGEIVRRGGNRGVTGEGSRSYLKYGMTKSEWIANGRKPYTT